MCSVQTELRAQVHSSHFFIGRQRIARHLADRGIGVLITDHNVRETLRITDRAYIVHDGVIFRSGTPDTLADDHEVKRIYLGADFRLD